jgi:hypothetical protein
MRSSSLLLLYSKMCVLLHVLFVSFKKSPLPLFYSASCFIDRQQIRDFQGDKRICGSGSDSSRVRRKSSIW